MQLSHSGTLLVLGEVVVKAIIQNALKISSLTIVAHASATERLLADPEAVFELDMEQEKKIYFR